MILSILYTLEILFLQEPKRYSNVERDETFLSNGNSKVKLKLVSRQAEAKAQRLSCPDELDEQGPLLPSSTFGKRGGQIEQK